jgi:TPR repeat protein
MKWSSSGICHIPIPEEKIKLVEIYYNEHIISQDYLSSKLRMLTNDPTIDYYLGLWLIFATSFNKKTQKLGKLYLENIEDEFPQATYLLAKYYLSEKDYDKAKSQLEKIVPDHVRACNDLGYLYHRLLTTSLSEEDRLINKSKAESYYKLAIEKGNTTTHYNLGKLYYDSKDIDKAIQEFNTGASFGDKSCLQNLLIHYENSNDLYHVRETEKLLR